MKLHPDEGVLVTLTYSPELEVIGAGGSANDAIRIAQHDLPEIMLLDIHMPGRDGTQLAAELSKTVVPARSYGEYKSYHHSRSPKHPADRARELRRRRRHAGRR